MGLFNRLRQILPFISLNQYVIQMRSMMFPKASYYLMNYAAIGTNISNHHHSMNPRIFKIISRAQTIKFNLSSILIAL